MSEITYRFLRAEPNAGFVANHADDPKLALMAVCVATQQAAGFREAIDLREVHCPDCGASGFNTGWGVWRFVCDAAIHSDGEPADPCGAVEEAQP